jgi:hypothetical protein
MVCHARVSSHRFGQKMLANCSTSSRPKSWFGAIGISSHQRQLQFSKAYVGAFRSLNLQRVTDRLAL